MNETNTWFADNAKAVEHALDTASRHWRDEYDQMTVTMVATKRRDHAIAVVAKVLADFAAEEAMTTTKMATLIVDNSELAMMGFDARNTTPQTAFGRWFWRWW